MTTHSSKKFPSQEWPKLGAEPLERGLSAQPSDSNPPKGRILKLRIGVNPNSSSVGTNVVVFIWSLAACATVFSVSAGLLASHFRKPQEDASQDPEA